MPEESAAGAAGERGRFSPTVIRGDFKASLPGAPVAPDVEAVDLPLYGRIAAGTPIEALRDQSATVGVPASLLGHGSEHYALEVAGDSMIEAGILDGDTVIIERSDSAENGAVVVALVDKEEVTLKRLRRRGASIALEPANKAYETRIFGPDRVEVRRPPRRPAAPLLTAAAAWFGRAGHDTSFDDTTAWAQEIIALVKHRTTEADFVCSIRPLVVEK